VALLRQEDSTGVRIVLLRCYTEQWLVRCFRDGHVVELRALQRLGRDNVGAALVAALDEAARENDERSCLEALIVSLSALRVLAVFDDASPTLWLERAAWFGPSSLRALPRGACARLATCVSTPEVGSESVTALARRPSRPLAYTVTAWLRMEAINRLLRQNRCAGIDLLIEELQYEDYDIALTAIDCLQRLREKRALPFLHAIAFGSGHSLAAQARRAVESIGGTETDALILIRPAQQPHYCEILVKAAVPIHDGAEHETLVRV